ncbi:ORF_006L [Scale drop disease virus]|uniref:ORF_006L n=1 Tax=Scale drop disease virus TaxID=1697349 RepID=A0A0K1L633_9VIRU|nr:ORF_006L [Scale drop disease virus]AKU37421.1 ORF_006L [Scale drop disease virus]
MYILWKILQPAQQKIIFKTNRCMCLIIVNLRQKWGYRKRTAIWTNAQGLTSCTCVPSVCAETYFCPKTLRYRHFKTTDGGNKHKGTVGTTKQERYRIPPKLIHVLFSHVPINKTNGN